MFFIVLTLTRSTKHATNVTSLNSQILLIRSEENLLYRRHPSPKLTHIM